MIFIAAGIGGGTGTGAAPVIAEIAQELGALDDRRDHQAVHVRGQPSTAHRRGGRRRLQAKVDTLITIPNDRLNVVDKKMTSNVDAFRVVDDVLRQASRGSATSSRCPA